MSSELKLIYQNLKKDITKEQKIYLLCVFRDEEILLPYFIDYYKSIGVTHFIMIDNVSEDNGVAYLRELKDVNIVIYSAEGSFREAVFGSVWINELLNKYCIDQYCFVVDIDELFYINTNIYTNLHELIVSMESHGSNAIPCFLLDMYPKVTNNNYQKGENFLEHSNYFDQYNTKFYQSHRVGKTIIPVAGGMRSRVFNKCVCLQKFSFFKYSFSPGGMAGGFHNFKFEKSVTYKDERIILHDIPTAILHFKFIKPNVGIFFKKRFLRNEDSDNSDEYKSYSEAFTNRDTLKLFDKNYSIKFDGDTSLKTFFTIQKKCYIISQKNVEIKQIKQELNEKNKIIQQKENKLKKHNVQLKEKDGQIEKMQSSKFWKMRKHYIVQKNRVKFIFYFPIKFCKKYIRLLTK